MPQPFIFAVFLLLALASTSCQQEDCIQESACELEPDPGNCLAAFSRYYYDPVDGKCKEFTWGGCAGTVPFEDLIACEQACTCASK